MGFICTSHEGTLTWYMYVYYSTIFCPINTCVSLYLSTYINPYTPQRRGISDIYSVASYRYFGGTFRMAHLASG